MTNPNLTPDQLTALPSIAPETTQAIDGVAFLREVPAGTTDHELRILHELEPLVEENLNRHLAVTKDWMPHDYIPWSQGRDFAFLDGEDWRPEDSQIDPIARTAMLVNLLTEDNLPSYHREIATKFTREGAWGQWVGRWTAEEGRHSIALRDYVVVTRAIDPVKLETLRMQHMEAGFEADDKGLLDVTAYVAFQELATRVSHRNTGAIADEPMAEQLLGRISQDENLHMIFYRNLVAGALEVAPNEMMQSITKEVKGFAMPGQGMPDFLRNAAEMAKAGIYDLPLHLSRILRPNLQFWKIDDLNLSGEGDQARDALHAFLEDLDAKATRFAEQRDTTRERLAKLGRSAVYLDARGKLVRPGE